MKRFLIIIILFTVNLLLVTCVSLNASLRGSANYGIQSDVVDQGGTKSTSTNYILRQGSAGQHGTIGSSESASYAAGQGYIYTTNTKPLTPESLAQYRADGTTAIDWPAGWTNTATEIMKFNIEDPDPGDILTPQIEVAVSGESFSGTPSFEGGNYNYSGSTISGSVSATGMAHNTSYIWQARVKDLENFYSDWVSLGGAPDYRVDLYPPASPEVVISFASPEASPTYVYLSWQVVTDEASGIAGYNVYRSYTPGSGYTEEVYTLVTTTSTTDATVSFGTDYYYVITAQDNAGSESFYSHETSAPLMSLTREVQVSSPGGYTGSADDPVPGSTMTYYYYYNNKGFAKSVNITIIDHIPQYTEYKIGTATGESITSVTYSSNEGVSWDYIPVGTYVDPNVTNIRWLCNDISSGGSAKVEYGTVIR